MRRFLLCTVATALIAQPLPERIRLLVKHHTSTKEIAALLLRTQTETERAQNLPDPVLSIGINDLHSDRPFDLSLEPMQTTYIAIAQKLVPIDKRVLQKKIALQRSQIVHSKLLAWQDLLALKIYKTLIAAVAIRKKLTLIKRYLRLYKNNSRLLGSYASLETKNHLNLMKNDLFIDTLQERTLALQSKLEQAIRSLRYFGFSHPPLSQWPTLRNKKEHSHNPILTQKKRKILLQHSRLALAKKNERTDPTLKLGYFHRFGFPDYVSLSVSLPLPLYGTQKVRTQEERIALEQMRNAYEDYRKQLATQIDNLRTAQHKIEERLDLLTNHTLPLFAHLLNVSLSSVTSGTELYQYLDLLEKRFGYEMERIELQKELFENRVEQAYLQGAIL